MLGARNNMNLERGAGVTCDDNNRVSPRREDLQSGATTAARLANEVKSGPLAAAAEGTDRQPRKWNDKSMLE